ncbi:MAG: alpha-amylase family glycosyl hydrolase, partial [Ignavibacteria bacterium]|nr:alpha-amylase family glycosyl hydrolase [Ignavibacteria bacterium]
MKRTALRALEEALRKRPSAGGPYYVPPVWVSSGRRTAPVMVDPSQLYLKIVRKILKDDPPRLAEGAGGEWTRDAVVYNIFIRTTTAFDHDRDGVLHLGLNSAGMRETGTFLKGIAILPYLRRLGVNTLHLLPITAIGRDGNKGTLGSPYAIRNPYELDERLGEPSLGLDVKTEFRAFVEAAHSLGMRVVVEFVFRTAAKDSDWVRDHPEWFYWIREDTPNRPPGSGEESAYGTPVFTPDELGRIREAVSSGSLDKLIPPHQVYRDFFHPPPGKGDVRMEEGRYIGTTVRGIRVKIPGAFADWPPDDPQPPWDDVTYLKLFDHPDFDYIAYNTIRMYDAALTTGMHEKNDLWDKISGIIPYYQREFGIDGVMID